MNRFKSKVFWISATAILFLVMANYGLYDYIGMPEGTFRNIMDLILTAVGILGTANNPTNPNGF